MQNTHDLLVGTLSIGIPSIIYIHGTPRNEEGMKQCQFITKLITYKAFFLFFFFSKKNKLNATKRSN